MPPARRYLVSGLPDVTLAIKWQIQLGDGRRGAGLHSIALDVRRIQPRAHIVPVGRQATVPPKKRLVAVDHRLQLGLHGRGRDLVAR